MAEQISSSAFLASNPDLVTARAAELSFQSPYFFLRGLALAPQQLLFGTGAATRFGSGAGEEIMPFEEGVGQWLLSQLAWDTAYFKVPSYRLFTALFTPSQITASTLAAAAQKLRAQLASRGPYYAFSVVPAQDIAVLQALTAGGWRLIETRLHYYHDDIPNFQWPRYAVRLAQPMEAAQIGAVAAAARNPYDRFHADPWFGPALADAFLAHYAATATVGDYGNAVLVPAEPGLSIDSFLAISDLKTDAKALGLAEAMSRVLLTAVGPANRGWHLKLVSETVHRARELAHQYVLMTTQATNGAVFRTSEKLGFKLGGVSHVLACFA